jgi:hypothetical protein
MSEPKARAAGSGRQSELHVTVSAPRHFLEVADLTPEELRSVLRLAERPVSSLGRPLSAWRTSQG